MPPEAFQVALFLRDGARSVFLQDADPCAVAPATLAAVIEHVRRAFPTVTSVTTYGRAATLARRRPPQLALLVAAGLTRVHIGMESGSDDVLARVDKGCTAAQLVAAGRRVLEAGMELCFYVMPGLGGRDLADAHVRGTAAVLREVAAAATPARPLVVRLRTTAVVPGTPLADDEAAGRFMLPDDVEVAAELRALLELLDGVRLELRSDHALNLCPASPARCRTTARRVWRRSTSSSGCLRRNRRSSRSRRGSASRAGRAVHWNHRVCRLSSAGSRGPARLRRTQSSRPPSASARSSSEKVGAARRSAASARARRRSPPIVSYEPIVPVR